MHRLIVIYMYKSIPEAIMAVSCFCLFAAILTGLVLLSSFIFNLGCISLFFSMTILLDGKYS